MKKAFGYVLMAGLEVLRLALFFLFAYTGGVLIALGFFPVLAGDLGMGIGITNYTNPVDLFALWYLPLGFLGFMTLALYLKVLGFVWKKMSLVRDLLHNDIKEYFMASVEKTKEKEALA